MGASELLPWDGWVVTIFVTLGVACGGVLVRGALCERLHILCLHWRTGRLGAGICRGLSGNWRKCGRRLHFLQCGGLGDTSLAPGSRPLSGWLKGARNRLFGCLEIHCAVCCVFSKTLLNVLLVCNESHGVVRYFVLVWCVILCDAVGRLRVDQVRAGDMIGLLRQVFEIVKVKKKVQLGPPSLLKNRIYLICVKILLRRHICDISYLNEPGR